MAKASVLQFKDYTVEEILFKNVPVSGDKHEFEYCFYTWYMLGVLGQK